MNLVGEDEAGAVSKELDDSILHIVGGFPFCPVRRGHQLSDLVVDPGKVSFKERVEAFLVPLMPLL